jgi:hypothetical protein
MVDRRVNVSRKENAKTAHNWKLIRRQAMAEFSGRRSIIPDILSPETRWR